jgi:pimeloyl-ACP methyl ester carboxylesterase
MATVGAMTAAQNYAAGGSTKERRTPTAMKTPLVNRFHIEVPRAVLDDLQRRLRSTRWPEDEAERAGWEYGVALGWMKELVAYWRDHFDWQSRERALNAFTQFRVEIDALNIHFIHERGKGPKPMPILITHGWPSTFAEMIKLIPLLTDPEKHGGNREDSFDVIVPSVPGYGFSDRPTKRGFSRWHVAGLWAKLMDILGYPRFGAHANDIGAVITGYLGLDYPQRLIGLHTLMPHVPYPYFGEGAEEMSKAERAFVEMQERWDKEEGGYSLIQETRPQTLGYGLNDSPAGLAAWILEKWRAWSGDPAHWEKLFTKDELLTQVMIFWVTQTANSAARSYYERAHDSRKITPADRITVPTGVALTTEEVQKVPRKWAERVYTDIRRWTELSRGGHFLAMEEPELLAAELREFFRPLR